MFQSERDSQTEKIDLTQKKAEALWQFNERLARSVPIVHWLGYGLLVFFIFDLIEIITPPNFTNPAWELQAMGAVIERIVVPLLGLALVFFGGLSLRAKWEPPTLKVLSWSALLFAVVLFLLIPLGILNTVRIEQQTSSRLTTQVEQRMTQIQELKKQLKQATTEDQMESLLGRLDNRGRSPNIENPQQLEEIKKELSDFLERGEAVTKTQAETAKKNQRLSLLKSSVKWNLGALVSGVLFVLIWQGTKWSRS
jgi:large-conductance mechanosensitive channel